MFIPLDLNLPLIVGGWINWLVTSRSKDASVNKQRGEAGTLLASGFIAGGALMGVVSAILRFAGFDPTDATWMNSIWSHTLSLLIYILLIGYFIKASMKKNKA